MKSKQPKRHGGNLQHLCRYGSQAEYLLLAELGDKLTGEQRDELQMLCLGVLQDARNKRPKHSPTGPHHDASMEDMHLEGYGP